MQKTAAEIVSRQQEIDSIRKEIAAIKERLTSEILPQAITDRSEQIKKLDWILFTSSENDTFEIRERRALLMTVLDNYLWPIYDQLTKG